MLSFYLPTKHQRDKKRFILSLKNRADAIKQEINRVNPDIIISFQQEATFMLKELIGRDLKVITMFHNNPSDYFESSSFTFCRSALEKSECCQVLMPEYIDELKKKLFPKRVVCIPNAVSQFKQKAFLEQKTIVNIARVSRVKRQHLLIEAFALLKDKYPDWKVEIWGDTSCDPVYTKELKQLVMDHKLCMQVSFCGVTNDVEEKLEQASIFILPSKREGFGLALAEAMSKGVPAIGCKSCPAVNSLIKDQYSGLLCEDTPTDLADKIEQLIKSQKLRQYYGNNAKRQMNEYSADVIWDRWDQLISSIVKE